MPKWTRPSEGMPECEAGDRIVLIVNERPHPRAPLRRRLVLLEATETGWYSDDDTYAGYTPHDGEFWTTEKSVCEFAKYAS